MIHPIPSHGTCDVHEKVIHKIIRYMGSTSRSHVCFYPIVLKDFHDFMERVPHGKSAVAIKRYTLFQMLYVQGGVAGLVG